jgi:hypothetical protein
MNGDEPMGEVTMPGLLRREADWHWKTVALLWQRISLWVFAIPAIAAVAIYFLNTESAIAPYLTKDAAEIAAPALLAIPLAIATWLAATRPHVYFKWQALFALALFFRELHFVGTNTGFYIAIVLLLGWASLARERLEPFFSNRIIVQLLTAIIWVYLVSKTFDRHMWDRVLPAGTTNDLFEENLEILGHALFLALTCVSMFVDSTISVTTLNQGTWLGSSDRSGL